MKILLTICTAIVMFFLSDNTCYAQNITVHISTIYEEVYVGDQIPVYITLEKDTVSWNSDNPNVAIVSDTGMVTAIAPGVATIKATFYGYTQNIIINVKPPKKKYIFTSQDTILLPYMNSLTLFSDEYDMTKAKVSYSIIGQNVASAELGKVKDNQLPIKIEQTGIGIALMFIETKLENGDVEELMIKIYALDVNNMFIKKPVLGAAAYIMSNNS